MASDIPKDPSILFSKQNILGKNTDVTLNDLAKVRGSGLGMGVTAYNQLKLFLSKGIIIRDNDIKKFVRGLDSAKIENINNVFTKVLEKNALLQTPEDLSINSTLKEVRKAEKMQVKETKQTIKAARAFSEVMLASMTTNTVEDTAKFAEPQRVANRLEAALFVEKNMDDILKSTLYALRSSPGLQELPKGPAKDFIQFINDKKLSTSNDAELKKAVRLFSQDIRTKPVAITSTELENYRKKNPDFMTYKNLKDINEDTPLNDKTFKDFTDLLKMKPSQSIIYIQNRERVYNEMNSVEGLSPNSLFELIQDSKMGVLVGSVLKQHTLEKEFEFLKLIGKYEALKERDAKNKVGQQIYNQINVEAKTKEHINVPDSLRKQPDSDEKINNVKEHLLGNLIKNYKLEFRDVLTSGEKLLPNKKEDPSIISTTTGQMKEQELNDILGSKTDSPNILNFKKPKK